MPRKPITKPIFLDHCEHGISRFAGTTNYNGMEVDVYFYKDKHLQWESCLRYGIEIDQYCSRSISSFLMRTGFPSDWTDTPNKESVQKIRDTYHDKLAILNLFLYHMELDGMYDKREVLIKYEGRVHSISSIEEFEEC